MQDPRVHKLAKLLVEYSARVQANDQVAIMGRPETMPLIEALFESVLEHGGHPTFLLDYELTDEYLLRKGNAAQVAYVPPLHKLVYENFDVLFKVRGEANTRGLTGVAPNLQAARREAILPLTQLQLQRGATGKLRWVVCLFPTQAYAMEADMSLREYEDFVYSACHVNGSDDPVAHWKKCRASSSGWWIT